MRRLLQWNGQEERLSKETKRSCGMWSQHSFSTSGKCIRERRQTVSLSISFSFAGIIAPIVVQISFQNHKWNHWNPIRKWMSWDVTSAVWQEVYHCASKIYLLWIFIKTKFFSCSDVHMGNYRGFSVCNVFSWRWQIIWQILSAAPVSLHLHSSLECAGVSNGGLTVPLSAFGIILPLGMWTWRKFFFSIRWWGGQQEKTLLCLSHFISQMRKGQNPASFNSDLMFFKTGK